MKGGSIPFENCFLTLGIGWNEIPVKMQLPTRLDERPHGATVTLILGSMLDAQDRWEAGRQSSGMGCQAAGIPAPSIIGILERRLGMPKVIRQAVDWAVA